MKHVVVTGSTRGIGFGLAEAFLERGCQVTLNGRGTVAVESACASLADRYGSERIAGRAGDVSSLPDVRALWDHGVEHFGKVDIWINNAGLGHASLAMWELPPERVQAIVDVNVIGVINGSRVAVTGMQQQGYGQLYNMAGYGSRGQVRYGASVYGASKSAVAYLTETLVKETEALPIQVGLLSPGMVVTDLVRDELEQSRPADRESGKRVFNILGERVETVAPWLADEVLKNQKHGAKISWLKGPKIFWRFLISPFNKRDLFGSSQ